MNDAREPAPAGSVERFLAAAVEYGIDPRPDRIDPLADLYDTVKRDHPVEERRRLLAGFTEMLEDAHGPALALYPFLWLDPSPGVVSTAALNFAVLADGSSPLDGPRHIIGMAVEACTEPLRPAWLLQGILLLGDRRLNDDLAEARRRIQDFEQIELTRAWSGFAYASAIDFLLDWLAEDPPEAVYGAVAAALARTARDRMAPWVMDVERWYPTWSSPDGEPFRVVSRVSFEDHARTIERRFRRLVRRERTPKVLPQVMGFWGLDA